MLDPDDPAPPRRRDRIERIPLDPLGIEELRAYIGELTAEIARAEAEIVRKQAHRGAADAVFGRPRG
jgi:uncharacterized small protein (DUF1192 family)